MALKLYHAEPAANSLKAMIYVHEKELPFESIYVDLHKFEQHSPEFIAINPEGQVPVLIHDGNTITHTTVIGEYLEDAFPDAPPLRPNTPVGNARMRYWNKFTDEHVMNYVSMWGWHRMVGVIARGIDNGEFDQLMERIPLKDQREKWKTARSGFSEKDLAHATRKIEDAVDKLEAHLKDNKWLAGDMYTLADGNMYSMLGMALERMFPEIGNRTRCPRLLDYTARTAERPGVKKALAMPNRTNPALRTFTGEAR
jgi:glutathione S-transferase